METGTLKAGWTGRLLSLILWLAAIHSAATGIALIIMPDSAMSFFGLRPCVEKFFPAQGGVFHLIMTVAYALAAVGRERYHGLILLIIVTKLAATAFLIVYSAFVNAAWIAVFSAVVDGAIGIAVIVTYRLYRRRVEFEIPRTPGTGADHA